jgi:hypothetical protein
MKIQSFLLAAVLAMVGAFSGMAWAQDTTSPTDNGGGTAAAGRGAGARLDFLSADEKALYLKTRHDVMETHPGLKAEQDKLRGELKGNLAQGGGTSTTDKGQLRLQFVAFTKKVDAAMIKLNPSVQPVVEKVNAHFKERLQQKAGGADAGGDTDNQ